MDPIDQQIHRLSEEISLGQRREFRERANVIGSGLGPKYVDGQRTDDVALCILVESKEPEHRLADADVLPEEIVTDSGRTVTIDVEEVSGGFRATGAAEPGQASPLRTERYRPMPGGVSISRGSNPSGGSSSALLYTEGDPVILTARHIATSGTEETVGAPIHQPALIHDESAQAIGTTRKHADWYPTDGTRTTEVDATLIDVSEDDVSSTYLGFGGPATDTGRMNLDQRVVHFGYNTGIRSGYPRLRDVETSVAYNFDGTYTVVHMEGLESYDRVSEQGSSGAMNAQIDYQTGRMRLVGMNIASNVEEDHSLQIPWRTIDRHFDGLTPAQ